MMRIRPGFAITGNRIKRHVRMARLLIHITNDGVQLQFRIALYNQWNQLLHNLIIFQGGFSHQFLLMLIFNHSYIINDQRTIDEFASRP